MSCETCGDKRDDGPKDFTKAIVELINPEKLILLRKVSLPASMGTEEQVPPEVGKYFNVVLVYEANSHVYLYSSDGIPTLLTRELVDLDKIRAAIEELGGRLDEETAARVAGDSALSSSLDSLSSSLSSEASTRATADAALGDRIDTVSDNLGAETALRTNADNALQANINSEAEARAAADTALNGAITSEVTARQTADTNLQGQIDAITASSDVKDIVGTRAELNSYDTSTLGNNDIIKVLQDESENGATTYYRWDTATQQFSLIGEEGPYYTKSQADTLLNAKQGTLTQGANISIVGNTISAKDTTYTAGAGINIANEAIGVAVNGIETAMLQDASVTKAKFAQFAVNNAIPTAKNIQPVADTPAAWLDALGGPYSAGEGGYWATYYNEPSHFLAQPYQYGWLETISEGGNNIYQRWTSHAEGEVLYRMGNATGWWDEANSLGAFRMLLDNKTAFTARVAQAIPMNADLNTLDYCQPGVYVCATNATVGSLTNSPTKIAFRMEVANVNGGTVSLSAGEKWANLVRTVTNIDGIRYTQLVSSNGDAAPVWTYGLWRMNALFAPFEPSDSLTMSSGYTLTEFAAGRVGRLININMAFKKDSGTFSSTRTVIATLGQWYRPLESLNFGAFVSNGEYTATGVAYLGVERQSGEIILTDSGSGHNWAKASLTYPAQDGFNT